MSVIVVVNGPIGCKTVWAAWRLQRAPKAMVKLVTLLPGGFCRLFRAGLQKPAVSKVYNLSSTPSFSQGSTKLPVLWRTI